jgi:hypothetical protein
VAELLKVGTQTEMVDCVEDVPDIGPPIPCADDLSSRVQNPPRFKDGVSDGISDESDPSVTPPEIASLKVG